MSNRPRADYASKERRRIEGELRNEEWRKLTPQQQIASLRKRPGESKRQIAKLEAK